MNPPSRHRRRITAKLAEYRRLAGVYHREALTLRDFVRLWRIRLSQSKIGPLVCPRPVNLKVTLRSLGPSVELRSHTTDISVLGELVVGNSYGPLAEEARTPVRTIVDLGANTGLAARWFLGRFPSARLVAVEPEPGNVTVLRRNLAAFSDRTAIIPACIGARERKVTLIGPGEDSYAMRDDGDIDVVTMAAVFERLGADRIDLLKVDIEGAEAELFSDCASWIGRTGCFSVECHLPFSGSDLIRLLKEAGARPRRVTFGPVQFGYQMVVGVL